MVILSILCLISGPGNLNAQDHPDDKMVVDLRGTNWGMEGTIPGEGVKLNFHTMAER